MSPSDKAIVRGWSACVAKGLHPAPWRIAKHAESDGIALTWEDVARAQARLVKDGNIPS